MEVHEFQCGICLDDIATDPVTPSCGHVFCSACLEEWRKIGRCCPVCRRDNLKEMTRVRDHQVLRAAFLRHTVCCLLCTTWHGPYSERERHMKERCLQRKTKCVLCAADMVVSLLGPHMAAHEKAANDAWEAWGTSGKAPPMVTKQPSSPKESEAGWNIIQDGVTIPLEDAASWDAYSTIMRRPPPTKEELDAYNSLPCTLEKEVRDTFQWRSRGVLVPGPKQTDAAWLADKNEDGWLRFLIKRLDGEKQHVHCSRHVLAFTLKAAFSDMLGVSTSQLRLVYQGAPAPDEYTLERLGVKNGDTLILILQITGGKPVILLRGGTSGPVTVSVQLDPYMWRFSALYPLVPRTVNEMVTWKGHYDATKEQFTLGGWPYSYLYWEAVASARAPFHFTEAALLLETTSEVVPFLQRALTIRGLRAREVDDFITYWLPQLQECSAVRCEFLPSEQLERLARLSVKPTPHRITRVFLLFRPMDVRVCRALVPFASLPPVRHPPRSSREWEALEWGAMRL